MNCINCKKNNLRIFYKSFTIYDYLECINCKTIFLKKPLSEIIDYRKYSMKNNLKKDIFSTSSQNNEDRFKYYEDILNKLNFDNIEYILEIGSSDTRLLQKYLKKKNIKKK